MKYRRMEHHRAEQRTTDCCVWGFPHCISWVSAENIQALLLLELFGFGSWHPLHASRDMFAIIALEDACSIAVSLSQPSLGSARAVRDALNVSSFGEGAWQTQQYPLLMKPNPREYMECTKYIFHPIQLPFGLDLSIESKEGPKNIQNM